MNGTKAVDASASGYLVHRRLAHLKTQACARAFSASKGRLGELSHFGGRGFACTWKPLSTRASLQVGAMDTRPAYGPMYRLAAKLVQNSDAFGHSQNTADLIGTSEQHGINFSFGRLADGRLEWLGVLRQSPAINRTSRYRWCLGSAIRCTDEYSAGRIPARQFACQ